MYTFRQGLKDTATYAWVGFAFSVLSPGGQPATLTFASVSFVATVFELGLYSNDPFWEGIREVIKMGIPIKNPLLEKVKDEAINQTYDIIKKNISEDESEKNKYTPCP